MAVMRVSGSGSRTETLTIPAIPHKGALLSLPLRRKFLFGCSRKINPLRGDIGGTVRVYQ
ncbi:hypothetical protein GMSM_39070 [Geomonas sp. Red276]